MSEEFDDIDTPADEAILAGFDGAEQDGALESLKAIAGDEDEGQNTSGGDGDASKRADSESEGNADGQPRDDGKQDRDAQIPRGRFDEVNSKLKAERERREELEAELAQLRSEKQAQGQSKEGQQTAEPGFDYKAARAAYREALVCGDDDKADALMDEIEKHREADLMAKVRAASREEAQGAVSAKESKTLLDAAVAKALNDYPELNDNGGDNQQLKDVVEWRDFYISRGQAPHEALTAAVAKVMPQKAAQPNDPPVDQRKQKAIERNAADAERQPAAPSAGIGNRGVPSAPVIETQEQWDRLPESERERMLM